jgi:hypothetical protein
MTMRIGNVQLGNPFLVIRELRDTTFPIVLLLEDPPDLEYIMEEAKKLPDVEVCRLLVEHLDVHYVEPTFPEEPDDGTNPEPEFTLEDFDEEAFDREMEADE